MTKPKSDLLLCKMLIRMFCFSIGLLLFNFPIFCREMKVKHVLEVPILTCFLTKFLMLFLEHKMNDTNAHLASLSTLCVVDHLCIIYINIYERYMYICHTVCIHYKLYTLYILTYYII